MQREATQKLKEKYIVYYSDVPIQKYAAMSIARDEDTIMRWRKEDSEFADAVQRAKAEWVRKKVLSTKAEFALERLEKDVFSVNSTYGIEANSEETSSHEFLREIATTIKEAYKDVKPFAPPPGSALH